MRGRNFAIIGTLCALVAGGALLGVNQAEAQSAGVEELTRGPLHEAFASSISFDPEPGIIVKVQPPTPIEEVPPDQRPVGENIAWIPGYWAWDEEANDYLWISGVWRNLPPDRQWVPGYWASLGSEWQWTSGYWSDENSTEVTYLSKPPATLEKGPSSAAPSDDQVWISGSWRYREDRYAWQPGYWEPARENWSWTPAYYEWTPRGYVFVDGYWDYDVSRRGTVFAPVRFQREVYSRPDYYYTPSTVIAVNVFLNHLFVRPVYRHYYFGDYYEPRYRNEGYYSSFAYHDARRGYDPIYVHNRWNNRRDPKWDRNFRDNFDFYRDNRDARPPRTWADLQARPDGERRGRRDNFEFAQPLNRFVSNNEGRQRFEAVDRGQRDRIVAQRQDFRKFGEERQRSERSGSDQRRGGAPDLKEAIVQKIGRSPFAGKRADQLTGNDAPPSRRGSREEGRQGEGRPGQNPAETMRNDRDRPTPGTPNVPGRDRDDQPGRTQPGNQTPGRDPRTAGREDSDPTPGKPNEMDRRETRETPASGRDRENSRPGRGGDERRTETPVPNPTPMPGRQTERPEPQGGRKAPESQIERPQPQTERKTPEREVQRPQPQTERKAPEREVQRPQPQTERKAPEREAQRSQPQQERRAPERQAERPQPQREARPQAQPERQARPQPQQQQQPQRQQARPQAQPQQQPQRQQSARPQREAQPQRQAPAAGGGGGGGGGGKERGKKD